MRYKKLILGMITSVFCLGLLNGCNRYSCDFHSSEEAQKYVLAKLKDKYKEEFVITKVKTYKEEKIGLNWVIAEVVIFYSLPDQHIKPDIEVILEEMDDVKSQQETLKNYKEWKKQNQHNETNPE